MAKFFVVLSRKLHSYVTTAPFNYLIIITVHVNIIMRKKEALSLGFHYTWPLDVNFAAAIKSVFGETATDAPKP
jgi:hypothetical protein